MSSQGLKLRRRIQSNALAGDLRDQPPSPGFNIHNASSSRPLPARESRSMASAQQELPARASTAPLAEAIPVRLQVYAKAIRRWIEEFTSTSGMQITSTLYETQFHVSAHGS